MEPLDLRCQPRFVPEPLECLALPAGQGAVEALDRGSQFVAGEQLTCCRSVPCEPSGIDVVVRDPQGVPAGDRRQGVATTGATEQLPQGGYPLLESVRRIPWQAIAPHRREQGVRRDRTRRRDDQGRQQRRLAAREGDALTPDPDRGSAQHLDVHRRPPSAAAERSERVSR